MKKIIKIKKIPKKLFLFIYLLFALLTITIGSYYYFTHKPKIEDNNPLNVLCEQENKDLNFLETKIKILQEELKQANLTPEAKTNLEQIIKKQQDKATNLKNFITFQFYMNHLETEIQIYEKKLKNNEAQKDISVAKKHTLTEKKLAKEKELLSLKEKQKLFSEKDELQNNILKDLQEKLKKPDLIPADKTTLETEKTKFETKIKEINQEINHLVIKMELKHKIEILTEEIEKEKDETLKKLFIERKEICQKQLETLN